MSTMEAGLRIMGENCNQKGCECKNFCNEFDEFERHGNCGAGLGVEGCVGKTLLVDELTGETVAELPRCHTC